ncbi:MAG: AGE family epimerase/isomerase [Bdellovibrio sp.]|nr:AGE family epimerase/isomerase [Bdellovibrio sp.]
MQMSLKWLTENVFPFWIQKGIDSKNGSFVESISLDGEPQSSPRRALVQARQIYSFVEAYKLNMIDLDTVSAIVEKAVGSLIKFYENPRGAYIHSVDVSGQPANQDLDLYTQAFVLFGLAQAYDILRKEEIKHEALKVLKYLNAERKLPAGGFSEIKNNEKMYHSNPHMHLFEAALVWTKVDDDPRWHALTLELCDLCLNKFIDPVTGFLAEHFDEQWNPLRENGNFIFEPGHHFEWAWLLLQYEEVTGLKLMEQSQKLFDLAEKFGVSPDRTLAYDEVWSDGQPKKTSSRFWPQCERIKAATDLGQTAVADEAMQSLFKNFIIFEKGMWRDTKLASGEFDSQPVKASSLYHIINAISVYVGTNSKD